MKAREREEDPFSSFLHSLSVVGCPQTELGREGTMGEKVRDKKDESAVRQ